MIDVGFWEVAMIGVLALIILGPERLPGVARTAGTWMGKARRMMNDIKADLKSELNEADLDELKTIRDDIQQAGDSFKSQLEDNEDKLQQGGSAIDTAIADALNKPVPGSATSEPTKKPETSTKKPEKSTKTTKTTKKKTAGKQTSAKDPAPDKEKSS